MSRGARFTNDERKDYSKAMLAFSLSLSTATSLDEVLQVCVDTALCVSGLESAAVYLATEATRTMHMASQRGLPAQCVEKGASFSYDSHLMRRILAGEVAGWTAGSPADAAGEARPGAGLASYLILPMHYRRRVIGCLLVGSPRGNRRLEGNLRWLETIATLMAGATVRLRMESLLGESEKRYQRLLLHVPGVVFQFVMHPDGSYSFPFISASARDVFGMEPATVMSGELTPYHNLHPEDSEQLGRTIRQPLSKERPFRMELRHLVDGELRWCDCHSRPQPQPNGDILWDGVMMDITDRKRMEKELQEAKGELERRVEARTSELARSNQQLVFELAERKKAEEKLRRRETQLQTQAKGLEEVNTALKVLLKRREDDKSDLENSIKSNIQQLVLPFLEKLKVTRLSEQQTTYLALLESTLQDVVSPFINNLSYKNPKLTPAEIRVAQFVREGLTTKEISQAMSLSPHTIETHRKNLRRKLGIDVVKGNLRSHLLHYQI
ncbi:MAG: LuxR C-terminal-related transcriptional regulator [Deltaproteobacteria bacterium]|nr:LuxR C-terminal-related transcriptional regulator [Deltaproteobacteria bacterium]